SGFGRKHRRLERSLESADCSVGLQSPTLAMLKTVGLCSPTNGIKKTTDGIYSIGRFSLALIAFYFFFTSCSSVFFQFLLFTYPGL
ncbi:MAG: hypothetical protein ACHP7O_06575, partial [Burkholderiales bacterium]